MVTELLARLGDGSEAGFGHRVGLTGPPGVGKSSLVAVLARELRARGKTVGVVAVDPSSVQSGGALLGDRARMAFDPNDRGLFVRSLATQGALGGLAHPTHAAVEVLACGVRHGARRDGGRRPDRGRRHARGRHRGAGGAARLGRRAAVPQGRRDGDPRPAGGEQGRPRRRCHARSFGPQVGAVDPAPGRRRRWRAGGLAHQRSRQPGRGRAGSRRCSRTGRHWVRLGSSRAAQKGRKAWATEWLTRRVGTLGVEALGGIARVGRVVDESVGRDEPTLSAVQALADRLTLHVR